MRLNIPDSGNSNKLVTLGFELRIAPQTKGVFLILISEKTFLNNQRIG